MTLTARPQSGGLPLRVYLPLSQLRSLFQCLHFLVLGPSVPSSADWGPRTGTGRFDTPSPPRPGHWDVSTIETNGLGTSSGKTFREMSTFSWFQIMFECAAVTGEIRHGQPYGSRSSLKYSPVKRRQALSLILTLTIVRHFILRRLDCISICRWNLLRISDSLLARLSRFHLKTKTIQSPKRRVLNKGHDDG
jgi:hypothetical protein